MEAFQITVLMMDGMFIDGLCTTIAGHLTEVLTQALM